MAWPHGDVAMSPPHGALVASRPEMARRLQKAVKAVGISKFEFYFRNLRLQLALGLYYDHMTGWPCHHPMACHGVATGLGAYREPGLPRTC